MNPDQLGELEEERRFLLRSLTDLERELEAGDVDSHDYEVLRDGYTARAAAVIRQIDEGKAALPPMRRWPVPSGSRNPWPARPGHSRCATSTGWPTPPCR
jgi:hypothetical protein